MFSRKADGRLFHTAGPPYAKLRCSVEVWTQGSIMQRVDADRNRGRPWTSSTGQWVLVDMLERLHWHTSMQLRRTWKWLVVVLVAGEDYAVLARRGHGVELLTRGELEHSGQPGVASSVHPLLRSVSHCSSPDDCGQKPEQGIAEHPLSVTAGLRAADVAGRSKIGIQKGDWCENFTVCKKTKTKTEKSTTESPSPPTDNIWAMVIVWRVRREIIWPALCCCAS